MPPLSGAKATGEKNCFGKSWFQAFCILGCFPEMANSKIAVHSSFFIAKFIKLPCYDTLQASLQNFNKWEKVHLLLQHSPGKPLGVCFCLSIFGVTPWVFAEPPSGDSLFSLFDHVQRSSLLWALWGIVSCCYRSVVFPLLFDS